MKGFHIIIGVLLNIALLTTVYAADIYKVRNIKQGESLKLKQLPSKASTTLVALPHDASWLLRRDKGRKVVKKVVWRKVQWNNAIGWVSAHYIANDSAASAQAKKRLACLKDRTVKEKICCGYTKAARKQAYKHVPILMVKNIAIGKSLIIYSQPTQLSKKIVAIPHNATWIADLGEKKRHHDRTMWSRVRWTGKIGWVQSSFVKSDPQTTHIGDLKRKMCAGS